MWKRWKQWKQDYVAVKFSKDVAGLIHLQIWKSFITKVNEEYLGSCYFDDQSTTTTIKSLTYNWRHCEFYWALGFFKRYVSIFTKTNAFSRANLPNNYFTIKELY